MIRPALARLLAAGAGSWIVAAAATACDRSAAVESNAPEVAVVERRDLEIQAEAAGLVEPLRVVEVKSKASGEILRMHVETGDEVAEGALLAEIDPRDVRNALAQAEADLEVAHARLVTAEAQRARTEELRRANVVTKQEYETAALEEANARAQLVKARTNLELARERMGDVTIQAPIAGTIIQKSVEEGQIIASASSNVSGGTTLLLMADLAEMQVRALVDETDIGRIAPGQPARVTAESYPGRPFAGEVLKIEPQAVVEQNVTMFPVLVRLDNPEGLLKPGMNAEVEIEIARRQGVVAVPNSAIVSPREALAAGKLLDLEESAVRAALGPMRGGSPSLGAGGGPGGGTVGEGAGEAARRPGRRDDAPDVAVQGATGSRPAPPGAAGGPGRDLRAGGSFEEPSSGRLSETGDRRPGVVFVAVAAGLEPRMISLGLNDWDFTEVLGGLEPGERVILMSVATLQQQQEEFNQRIRQRTGNPFSGATGQSRPEGARSGGGRP